MGKYNFVHTIVYMGSEHVRREHDCLVTIWKNTSTLLIMDKCIAALIVQAHLLKSKHKGC